MISFTVYGKPQSRGSKRPLGGRGKLIDSNPKSIEWMRQISQVAGDKFAGADLLADPIRIHVKLFFARPKSHFGTGKNSGKLKDSAPKHHTQIPDQSKCLRAVEDALTGVVYGDDRQICYATVEKSWTLGQARAEISVERIYDV